MLRYEQIIKEFLQDNRILIEFEGEQKIFKATLVENNLIIIKNVHDEIEYTIELR